MLAWPQGCGSAHSHRGVAAQAKARSEHQATAPQNRKSAIEAQIGRRMVQQPTLDAARQSTSGKWPRQERRGRTRNGDRLELKGEQPSTASAPTWVAVHGPQELGQQALVEHLLNGNLMPLAPGQAGGQGKVRAGSELAYAPRGSRMQRLACCNALGSAWAPGWHAPGWLRLACWGPQGGWPAACQPDKAARQPGGCKTVLSERKRVLGLRGGQELTMPR